MIFSFFTNSGLKKNKNSKKKDENLKKDKIKTIILDTLTRPVCFRYKR